MQVVIALPATAMERLETPVCGVPLLTRVVATAVRAGASEVLLVTPPYWPLTWLTRNLRSGPIKSVIVDAIAVREPFRADDREAWRRIAHYLEDRFLWLPYDYLAHKPALVELLATAASHPGAAVRFSTPCVSEPDRPVFEQPAILRKRDVFGSATPEFELAVVPDEPGVSARPPARIREVEAELVRRSGKVTDGLYSTFNRKVCRPAVRWLSHTRVTPNVVSFGGLAIGAVAGICFAQGTWLWDIAAAIFFFISGLFDEVDGMLARLKFQESAFGCWLETFVDYATYLLAFAGMTAGGYRRGGSVYLAVGAALLLGCLLSFFVISLQRKLTAPTRPTEYYQHYLKALDQDAGNLISRVVRDLQFLFRKGVLIHYILLFAILDLVALVFFLAALGANAAWAVTLYLNRRLFIPVNTTKRSPARISPALAEVER